MGIQAKAAVARAPGAPWNLETVDIEDPRPDEVLVRIVGVGLCHTDLVFSAHLQVMKAPAIFGHEGAGIVERVGENVTKVAPGDHVVLTFNSCGHCPTCDEGLPGYCYSFPQLNNSGRRIDGSTGVNVAGEPASAHFFGQSSFGTHALANQRNVVPIDKDVPLELMGPLGCGIQTGAGSVINSLACHAGSSLLILGGGAVGLSAVLGGIVQGCSTIIVAEPKEARRNAALDLGATHVIDPLTTNLQEAVRAIVPAGVNYVFDTSGLKPVIEEAIGCTAPHAKIGFVGISSKLDDAIALPINVAMAKGLTVMGIIEGDADPDTFIPKMIALYRQGKFPFDKLITTYRLDEINQAIADQHSGKCIKPVMLPSE